MVLFFLRRLIMHVLLKAIASNSSLHFKGTVPIYMIY